MTLWKERNDFEGYYRDTLQPELERMEVLRRRLVGMSVGAVVIFGVCIVVVLGIGIPALWVFLFFPFVFFTTYVANEARLFKASFKPTIVKLVLGYFGEEFHYVFNGYIHKNIFVRSKIFGDSLPYYRGEDLIKGKVGNTAFELCELDVRDLSPIDGNLRTVFRGSFFHAELPEPFVGRILMIPDEDQPHLMRTLKEMTRVGGFRVPVGNVRFESKFNTYADSATSVYNLLSDKVYEHIVDFREVANKKMYISILDSHIYIALSQPKDMLEPRLLSSNVDFELIREFYEDIDLLLRLVDDFDLNNFS